MENVKKGKWSQIQTSVTVDENGLNSPMKNKDD